MTIAEQIYELVKSLPDDQANEILSFAEFIRNKHLNPDQLSDAVTSVAWKEQVYTLAGSWAEDFLTLEEIRTDSV